MPSDAGGRRLPAPDLHFFRAAVHAIGDGVSLADRDGRIIYSNPAADRILGVSATDASPDEWAEYYGVFLPDRQTPFPADRYPLVLAVKGQSTDDVEMYVRNPAIPHGAVISVTGRPVRDSHGEIIGATVVFRDITRLRTMEAQKRELTGFLVHDMKSPLTSIKGNAELVLLSDALEATDREALADLIRSTEDLNRMVLDLLDVQTAEDGHLEPNLVPVPPLDLLRNVAASMSGRSQGVAFEIEVQGEIGVPPVRADPELLRRIVTNLVDNCIKYGPEKGRIWLSVRHSHSDAVRICVSDEGPGVPPELRPAIFEKYARVERSAGRRDAGSRGLGLRFCKLATEAHGGRIWVEDNDPVGARFCVELPRAT